MAFDVIVVGTDGSERADIALEEALTLAQVAGAKVHAVYAVHPTVAVGYVESKVGQLEVDKKRGEVDKVRDRLVADAESRWVTLEMHNPGTGDAADALISVAEAVNADLIVVGNRGMSGVTRFMLGSVPNKVSHHSPCSVLIVNTDRS
jgi:nucleotide-binding universal stress UspA family protein